MERLKGWRVVLQNGSVEYMRAAAREEGEDADGARARREGAGKGMFNLGYRGVEFN